MTVLGDKWWQRAAKREMDTILKINVCHIWKPRSARVNIGCVSTRSMNSARSRKGCVVNGQISQARN